MYISRIERRWSRLVAEGLFCDEGIGRVHDAQLSKLQGFLSAGNAPARWAFRLGLLLIAFAPLWRWRRLTKLSSLSVSERGELLTELLNHNWYPIRELAFMIKVSLTMMLLGDDTIRAATHYDNRVWEHEPVLQSGQRRRLRVVSAPAANENEGADETEVA